MSDPKEGDGCPERCGGSLHYPKVEGCWCHISPPCSACVDNRLVCEQCGWEEPDPAGTDTKTVQSEPNPWHERPTRTHTFGHGGRVFDWTDDGSSGSTHVIKGRCEGLVTAQDIISYFGSGTFGHRGPSMGGGRFMYTKITD